MPYFFCFSYTKYVSVYVNFCSVTSFESIRFSANGFDFSVIEFHQRNKLRVSTMIMCDVRRLWLSLKIAY